MSHFSVLVVARNEDELYERLIPYYEYGTSTQNDNELRRRGLVEFISVEEEYRKEYEEDGVKMAKMPDGRLLYTWDDEFRVPGTFGSGSDTHRVPDDIELVEVKHKDRYPDFGTFIEDWCGYKYDPEHKTWGYWNGLNEKWDWYTIGGRYSGRLLLKGDGVADTALVQYIDWNAMEEESVGYKLKNHRDFHAALSQFEGTRWKEEHWQEWQRARQLWEVGDTRAKNAQEAFDCLDDYARASAASAAAHYWGFTFQELADLYYKTEEEYHAMFTPWGLSYAFVDKRGNWHQRGEMGWWGMDDKSKATEDYEAAYWTFINSLENEDRVYMVDCHI